LCRILDIFTSRAKPIRITRVRISGVVLYCLSATDMQIISRLLTRVHIPGERLLKSLPRRFEWISVKFGVGEFYEKLSPHFGNHVSRIIVTANLHEDLHEFPPALTVSVALNICLRNNCFSLKSWRRTK
jgi:hypothetical protein